MNILNKTHEKYINEFKDGVLTPLVLRGHIAVHAWTATQAAILDVNGILAVTALLVGVQTITTFLGQPPCARNITITGHPQSTTMDKIVTITGTNIFGETISEAITESNNTTVQGAKAFKTVTSIALPVYNNDGDTLDVGYGDKLGLSMYLNYKCQVIGTALDGTIEAAATVVADSDEIEKNTLKTASTALNGQVVTCFVVIY